MPTSPTYPPTFSGQNFQKQTKSVFGGNFLLAFCKVPYKLFTSLLAKQSVKVSIKSGKCHGKVKSLCQLATCVSTGVDPVCVNWHGLCMLVVSGSGWPAWAPSDPGRARIRRYVRVSLHFHCSYYALPRHLPKPITHRLSLEHR